MTTASLAAYDAILPELPERERAVLGVLLERRATNRQIAGSLGLDRDSISPRTARLRQKGIVAEIGTRGKETIYEAIREPNFVKAPGKRKPKAYYDGIEAAAALVQNYTHEMEVSDGSGFDILRRSISRSIRELAR